MAHGYGLSGSGSNLWTREVARALVRDGHTVHLLCQESRPERFEWIAEAWRWDAAGRPERLFQRDTAVSGRCVVHRPDLEVLPTFVRPQTRSDYVFSILDLDADRIEEYLRRNAAAIGRIARDHGVPAFHVNHVLLLSEAFRRVKEADGLPYAVMPHGSALEYVVRKDRGMRQVAGRALAAADRILLLNEDVRRRLAEVFPELENLDERTRTVRAGVDTDRFGVVPPPERRAAFERVPAAVRGTERGRTPERTRAFLRALDALADGGEGATGLSSAGPPDAGGPTGALADGEGAGETAGPDAAGEPEAPAGAEADAPAAGGPGAGAGAEAGAGAVGEPEGGVVGGGAGVAAPGSRSPDAAFRAAVDAAADHARGRPDHDVEERLARVAWGEHPVALYVGRFVGGKGVPSVVTALPDLLGRHPGTRLLMVGAGPLREVMEAMVHGMATGRRSLVRRALEDGDAIDPDGYGAFEASRRHLARLEREGRLDAWFQRARSVDLDRVVFTGFLDHEVLCHLFPLTDVAIFPSLVAEASPLVVAEAAASGCFPMGTDFAGMRRTLDAVGAGLDPGLRELMRIRPEPERVVADIARNVADVLDRVRGREAEVAKALREVAVERFDWRRIGDALVRALGEVAVR